VLENVEYDPFTRAVNFDSDRITENTRGAYPIHFVPNHVPSGYAGHPENVFFLTADAFGVLPPLAKLTREQAMFYFLSGYTSKLAGTETGLGAEPEATFSTCFGSPFLPLSPRIYADLLGERIQRHNATVWLVNTGWTGGPYGVGSRFKLPYTRAMIHAVLNHALDDIPFHQEDYFGLWLPEHCPGVPDEVLDPQATWADKAAYRLEARHLVARFEQNYKNFSDQIPSAIPANNPTRH
jgi:phosphoenolpyruvate carboxykinase (ATP)